MEKLIIVKRYNECLETYEYSINYSRQYRVASNVCGMKDIERYVASSLIKLVLQEFKNLDLDKDVAIVDFTKEE